MKIDIWVTYDLLQYGGFSLLNSVTHKYVSFTIAHLCSSKGPEEGVGCGVGVQIPFSQPKFCSGPSVPFNFSVFFFCVCIIILLII